MLYHVQTFVKHGSLEIVFRDPMTSDSDADGHHLVSISNQGLVFPKCFSTLACENPRQLKQGGKEKSLVVQEVVIEAVLPVELRQRQ